MKGLKKIALVTAVAAAPFAAHAGGLQPLNDSQMGDVTGQAGVAIELSTQLTIDEIAYNQNGDGSFLMSDIAVGGFIDPTTGERNNLNLAFDIELQDSGDALISLDTLDGTPVQLGMAVGEFSLDGNAGSATMMSGFDMRMFLSHVDITAQVEDLAGNVDTTGSLHFDVAFAIENLDISFDVAAVSLEGFRMAGAVGDGSGVSSLETLKTGSITDIGALSATNPALVDMTIGAGEAISGGRNGLAAGADVLRIELDSFQADIWMPTINVGPNTVGNVAIENLQVVDTSVAVYGYAR